MEAAKAGIPPNSVVDVAVVVYINRLSDYLFTAARFLVRGDLFVHYGFPSAMPFEQGDKEWDLEGVRIQGEACSLIMLAERR